MRGSGLLLAAMMAFASTPAVAWAAGDDDYSATCRTIQEDAAREWKEEGERLVAQGYGERVGATVLEVSKDEFLPTITAKPGFVVTGCNIITPQVVARLSAERDKATGKASIFLTFYLRWMRARPELYTVNGVFRRGGAPLSPIETIEGWSHCATVLVCGSGSALRVRLPSPTEDPALYAGDLVFKVSTSCPNCDPVVTIPADQLEAIRDWVAPPTGAPQS